MTHIGASTKSKQRDKGSHREVRRGEAREGGSRQRRSIGGYSYLSSDGRSCSLLRGRQSSSRSLTTPTMPTVSFLLLSLLTLTTTATTTTATSSRPPPPSSSSSSSFAAAFHTSRPSSVQGGSDCRRRRSEYPPSPPRFRRGRRRLGSLRRRLRIDRIVRYRSREEER